jgi:DNA-binding transcriptional LysR family regulator
VSQNLDLYTLRVLDEIFKTGSLSRTADRLDLSQPAISMILGKLRKHFGDKLFVRVGNEMKPTAQAEGMRESVSAAIAAIEATLNYRRVFDPSTTERAFRIAVSDIGQIVMVPTILKAFRAEAPRASVEFSSISDKTPQLLQTGEIDFAVGLAPGMPDTFLQRAVFTESFCVLARTDHPRIKGSITLAQFGKEGHVRVVTSSSTYLIIDKALEQQSITRVVQVSVPNFMIVAKLVSESDCLCVLPRRAGLALAQDNPLQVLTPPFAMSNYQVRQYWHERQSTDGGNRWLRELVLGLFAL